MAGHENDGQEKIQMKDNPLQHIRKKYKRCCKQTILNNIKLLINMKAICGSLYIRALIQRQELSK